MLAAAVYYWLGPGLQADEPGRLAVMLLGVVVIVIVGSVIEWLTTRGRR
jgi:uncharacterized membrane protein